MKIRIILYTLCLSFIAFSSVGCSDDDNVVEFNKNVILELKDIEIDPGKESSFKITDGNGSYTVKSTDETIVTGIIDGMEVKVTGHKSGIASIIVTDNKGVSSVAKVLVYRDLTVETEAIDVLTSSSTKVKITSGNGDYRVESLDKNLDLSLETDEKGISYIIIKSNDVEVTGAIVRVYDRTMRSASIKVNVTDPYTVIKDDATERIQFRTIRNEVGEANVEFYNSKTIYDGFHTFGWMDDGFYQKKFELVILASDNDLKTPGVKNNAQVLYNLTGYGMGYVNQWTAVNLEVLKYDEATGLVWIVFNQGANQGIICMKI